MSKALYRTFFALSAFLLFSSVIGEGLVYADVLKEYGTTIDDRKPFYVIMTIVGIAGFALCIIDATSNKKRIAK